MRKHPNLLYILIILLPLFITNVVAESKPLPEYQSTYEDGDIKFRIVDRTPENISAFYQGREFKQTAIDEILNTCYFTVIIHNKTQTTLWLELDNWQFSQGKRQIKRINREYWKNRWDAINLNQAHRSTFGWTLMPEARDLRADEGVGGSIVIPIQDKPYTVTANFATRPDKSGPIKTVKIHGAQCVKDIKAKK